MQVKEAGCNEEAECDEGKLGQLALAVWSGIPSKAGEEACLLADRTALDSETNG